MDYDQLRKMTVVKLREEAQKFPDVKGVSGMKKEQLIELLCEKLGIDTHVRLEKIPADREALKKKIRELKTKRGDALARKEYKEAALYRRRIHHVKRHLRKAIKDALRRA
ncbi:MAG: transcription termination factor Rho [Candidatus Latescibacteria bacterium]|nr:transcription termination factor Rho [Candidatus Latescibacterota bacterium]NIM66363.1 transcription termination factor Rho [Candidatus Latescibacterota bacterium]NIO02842.1 transcription termination factor Rho [Candidatus Latescibacterota bacterium]NIO29977.1 transcription termination factor Rho [Candidatus Latescibacterota bacterium]NIO57592.1 transcription termination factor Rho [Candidatus Latescibacterota bacterium]